MNHEENKDRNDQERRYRESLDDIKLMRKELNILTGSVGELTVAIAGNDLGTVGMVGQQRAMNDRLSAFESRLDAIEEAAREAKLAAEKRQFYLMTIFLLIGTILGSAMNALFNHFSKK